MIGWKLAALGCVAALAAVAVVAVGTSWGDPGNADQEFVLGGGSSYAGVRQLPAYGIPTVSLNATDGSEYDLVASARDKLLMLYVGYTSCGDACPLQMAALASALRQLPPDIAEHVLVVFVAADPQRDTPAVVADWLAKFNPNFVGLSGDQAELNSMQRSLGLNPASHSPNDHGGYAVNHGTTVFAFPPESQKAELVYPMGTSAADYAADIEKLVEDGQVRQ